MAEREILRFFHRFVLLVTYINLRETALDRMQYVEKKNHPVSFVLDVIVLTKKSLPKRIRSNSSCYTAVNDSKLYR